MRTSPETSGLGLVRRHAHSGGSTLEFAKSDDVAVTSGKVVFFRPAPEADCERPHGGGLTAPRRRRRCALRCAIPRRHPTPAPCALSLRPSLCLGVSPAPPSERQFTMRAHRPERRLCQVSLRNESFTSRPGPLRARLDTISSLGRVGSGHGPHRFDPDNSTPSLATPSSALRTGTRALHERGDDLPRPPVIFARARRPTSNPPPIPSSNRAFQQGQMPRATRAARRPPCPRSRAPSCTPRCSSASRSQVRSWSTTERAGSS